MFTATNVHYRGREAVTSKERPLSTEA